MKEEIVIVRGFKKEMLHRFQGRTVLELEEGTKLEIEMGNRKRTHREGEDEIDLEKMEAAMKQVAEEECQRLLITCIFNLKHYQIQLILMLTLCNYDACYHSFMKFFPLACHFTKFHIFALFRVNYVFY